MFDISKQKIEIDCPNCKSKISITINQVANQEIVRCNCGQKIQLEDNNSSSKKSINDVNKAFSSLEKTINNIGK